jgi:hypothetical protein
LGLPFKDIRSALEHHSTLQAARKLLSPANYDEKHCCKEIDDMLLGVKGRLDDILAKVRFQTVTTHALTSALYINDKIP